MSDDARLHRLNDAGVRDGGRYVLYWMHRAQRAGHNPALQHAVRIAREFDASVLAVFVFTQEQPQRRARHDRFLLEGLVETRETLAGHGIKLIGVLGDPVERISGLADNALALVCDGGCLRDERRWRDELARQLGLRVDWVESEVVVPVECVSDKREYAARTIRKKINAQRERFLSLPRDRWPGKSSLPLHVTGDIALSDAGTALEALDSEDTPVPVRRFRGGTGEARRHLRNFLRRHLDGYADARNDPSDPRVSLLSPYLAFGQISPIEVACSVQAAKTPTGEDKEAFLEELIVRRELAFNYAWFEPGYDRYAALPDWARETLEQHRDDARQTVYTRRTLEAAKTDDDYWNAAMQEMLATGYMHNYMRMYWGKKILEWSETPERAFELALHLNNKYFLDGRIENSFTNVAWLFGLHDRAWTERDVFGKVRYMNANGLASKFDIDSYVDWAKGLSPESEP